jgi:hypothetical protein
MNNNQTQSEINYREKSLMREKGQIVAKNLRIKILDCFESVGWVVFQLNKNDLVALKKLSDYIKSLNKECEIDYELGYPFVLMK